MPSTPSALGAVVAVCLGSGITADGRASETTITRAKGAMALAIAHPEMTIILSGDGRKTDDPIRRSQLKTEAELMGEILTAGGIEKCRLLFEDESIDTVGNAILTTVRYLDGVEARPLYLVTSPFHEERATKSFAGILGDKWPIINHPCAETPSDPARAATEPGGIQWITAFYQGITPGDTHAAVQKLLTVGKPYYKTLQRLNNMQLIHSAPETQKPVESK